MSRILNYSQLIGQVDEYSKYLSHSRLRQWVRTAYARHMQRDVEPIFADEMEELFLQVVAEGKKIEAAYLYCPYVPLISTSSYVFMVDGQRRYIYDHEIDEWFQSQGKEVKIDAINRIASIVSRLSSPDDCPFHDELAVMLHSNIRELVAFVEQKAYAKEKQQRENRRIAAIKHYLRANTSLSLEIIQEEFNHYGNMVIAMMQRSSTDLEHVMDWLKSLEIHHAISASQNGHLGPVMKLCDETIRKLDRISFTDATVHADRWFALLNSVTDFEEDFDGLEEILKVGTRTWFRLKSQKCLVREGKLMKHCVGGGSYNVTGDRPTARIYSLRDDNNKPLVTIETNHKTGRPLGVRQIKGFDNEIPDALYRDDIFAFLNEFCDPVPAPCQDMLALKIIPKQSRDGFEFLAKRWWGSTETALAGGRAIEWPVSHVFHIVNLRTQEPLGETQGIRPGEIELIQTGMTRMQEADMILSVTEADHA